MTPTAILTVLAVALVAGVNARDLPNILNGDPADLHEFPYHASVRVWGEHYCSGAIISPRHIVTAAHCVAQRKESVTVVTSTISSLKGDVHTPTKIEHHEQFTDTEDPTYDIAVITLGNDIVFNELQNKIDLPTAPPPAGVTMIASGWGWLNASLIIVTPSLNKIQLQTISRRRCQNLFGSRIQSYRNYICAHEPAFGSCTGDSGSPLAYNGKLIGILSWGVSCGVGLPDVFTSIYHHLSWLSSIIGA